MDLGISGVKGNGDGDLRGPWPSIFEHNLRSEGLFDVLSDDEGDVVAIGVLALS